MSRSRELEHKEQKALFTWAGYQKCKIPALDLLYAIPNGGHRHKSVAQKLRAEGVRAGMPDVHLPVACQGSHSLYIEMKVKPNKPTPKQLNRLAALRDAGNMTAVCYSFEEARDTILSYLHD